MRPRPLEEIAAAAGGRLRAPGSEQEIVGSVTTDSRTAGPGSLFVALAGETSDGTAFVDSALQAGAAGAVVRSGAPAGGDPSRMVDTPDPGRALLDLARDERSSIDGLVFGVTGSTGKTCTKDFLASVLAQGLGVVASPASFNNEVGLPLTILSAPPGTQAIVCEMGARGPGHIRLLCEVARPSVGVVTNVGVAHMEAFGSPEVLRNAKAELPESLPAGGVAVLNADDPVVRSFRERTPARTVLYGILAEDAEVRARQVSLDRATGRASFVLDLGGETAPLRLAVPGEHMVANALAAAAAGWAAGLSIQQVARGLEAASVSGGRMQVFDTAAGVRVIDDAYNANPTSVAAALRAARWMSGDGRSIAVLGHMAELGSISVEEHERVGELLARLGVDELVTVGETATAIAVGAEREGVEPERIRRAATVEDAVTVLTGLLRPGDLVLVKASRVAKLERVVEALRSAAPAPAAGGASGPAGAVS